MLEVAHKLLPCEIQGLSEIAGRYAGIVCDVWGVLHDGVRAFGEAADALIRYRSSGASVVLVSNASRSARDVQVQLSALGVPSEAYDIILTAGDFGRQLLARTAPDAVYHIGPARDHDLFDQLGIRLVSPEEASLVVCTCLFNETAEHPESYADLFERLCSLTLPMLCLNPDISVECGGMTRFRAGSLARLYQRLGGQVAFVGKPFPEIYATALRELSHALGRNIHSREVLAVGDSLATDVAGAAGAGLDSLLLASGVHVRDLCRGSMIDRVGLTRLLSGAFRPHWVQRQLSW